MRIEQRLRRKRQREENEALEELIRAVGELKGDLAVMQQRQETYENKQSRLIRIVWMITTQIRNPTFDVE